MENRGFEWGSRGSRFGAGLDEGKGGEAHKGCCWRQTGREIDRQTDGRRQRGVQAGGALYAGELPCLNWGS